MRFSNPSHAWAPAAILEEEPRFPVTKNGVTFQPLDIKALISQIYTRSLISTVFTGERCEFEKPDRDAFGGYIDPSCRDLAPDFFHIVVTNVIGTLEESFVLDVDATAEVWNQPASAYRLEEVKRVNSATAMSYFPRFDSNNQEISQSTIYHFNPYASALYYVKMSFEYVIESQENAHHTSNPHLMAKYRVAKVYEYILELDEVGRIIGGEWTGNSTMDHPDFLWMATSKPSRILDVFHGIKYGRVSNLLKQSLKANI